MQRELKIRIWDKGNLRFLNNDEYFISFEHGIGLFISIGLLTNFGIKWQSTDNYEISQYIGLKDKNGNEIYEGDILHYHVDDSYKMSCQNLVCLYDVSNAWFNFYDKLKDHKDEYYWLEIRDHVEVVGNIYENPELL